MILPALAAIAVGAIIRYAVKEGIEYVVDKAREAVVQRLIERARRLAEARLLAKAREECPTCDPQEVLRTMTDPCGSLSRGNGSGPYRGGSHAEMTKPAGDGLDSHHVPAKSNYPSWRGMSARQKARVSDKWPAIQMTPRDHRQTFSYGRGATSQAYARAQQYAFREYGMLGAFALDVAEIKMKFGDKYDEALKEAGMYAACVTAFPDKYGTRDRRNGSGGSRRRK